MKTTPLFSEIQRIRGQLCQLSLSQWKTEMLYTWRWWLLVGLTAIPLLIWLMILDKKRAIEITLYGCLISIMADILDNIGTELLWWSYPIKLIPIVVPFYTPDSILVPAVLMVVYQYFSRRWGQFLISNLVAGAGLSFVAEPIFVWLGFYQLHDWRLVYSYLFYMVSTVLARMIIIGLSK